MNEQRMDGGQDIEIRVDDPRLTAYALGEAGFLSEAERAAVEAAIERDPSLKDEVEAIRAMAGQLAAELALEAEASQADAEAEPGAGLALTERQRVGLERAAERAAGRPGRLRQAGSRLKGQVMDAVAWYRQATLSRQIVAAGASLAIAYFLIIPVGLWGASWGRYMVARPAIDVAEGVFAWLDKAKSSGGHDDVAGAADSLDMEGAHVRREAWRPRPLGDFLLHRDNSDEAQVASIVDTDSLAMVVEESMAEAEMDSAGFNLSSARAPLVESDEAAEESAVTDTDAESDASAARSRPSPDPNRKIIKDAIMSIRVDSLDLALSQVDGIAAQAGGYLLDTRRGEAEGRADTAFIKIAVPVDQFELALGRIREVASSVIHESSSGQDVSQEYVDLQSEIANLEATQARIRGFLDQAKSVEEALLINTQLAEIAGEISKRKGRLAYLAERAAYSTISVEMQAPAPPATATPSPTITPSPTPTVTPTPGPAWNPGTTVKAASGTLGSILKVLIDLAIWVGIVLGPFLAIFWLLSRLFSRQLGR